MKYSYNLLVLDENSEVVVDHPITAEQAVLVLAESLKNKPEPEAQEVVPLSPRVRALKEEPETTSRAEDEKRAKKILKLLAKGKTPEEIAAKLGIKVQVVKSAKNHADARKVEKTGTGCPDCGSRGRHFSDCPRSKKTEKAEVKTTELPTPVSPSPLTEAQFDSVQEAMQDREFQSGKFALTNRLSPREVNAALLSTTYEDYIASR